MVNDFFANMAVTSICQDPSTPTQCILVQANGVSMLTQLPVMAFLKVLMVVQPPVFLDFSKLFKIAYN
jgi:hypothetical protein